MVGACLQDGLLTLFFSFEEYLLFYPNFKRMFFTVTRDLSKPSE